jgi:hypothetical protein
MVALFPRFVPAGHPVFSATPLLAAPRVCPGSVL